MEVSHANKLKSVFFNQGCGIKTYGDAFAEIGFQGMEMQSLEKWETISVLVTQNVFGNNSRKKLDFEFGGGVWGVI